MKLISSLYLTHCGRVTDICVGKLTNIGSDNGLSPGRRQAIIWTNARILLIGPLGTNFTEILIVIHTFSFKKMHLKMASAKWRPFVSASMCQIQVSPQSCSKTQANNMPSGIAINNDYFDVRSIPQLPLPWLPGPLFIKRTDVLLQDLTTNRSRDSAVYCEIRQAHRQHRCRDASQMSERKHRYNTQSRGFETSQN